MADATEQTIAHDEAATMEEVTATEPVATEGELVEAEDDEEIEEPIESKKVTLADLCAKGAALYAHKQWEEAAEIYATAAEQQADINGEMNPENSEILFLYGRSLFKVGQSKSDVLGGKAGSGDKKGANGAAKKGGKKAKGEGASTAAAAEAPVESEAQRVAEEGVAIVAAQKEGLKKDDKLDAKKPLFQFTGDENWDDSDEEVGYPGDS
jgi:hypothetical protein